MIGRISGDQPYVNCNSATTWWLVQKEASMSMVVHMQSPIRAFQGICHARLLSKGQCATEVQFSKVQLEQTAPGTRPMSRCIEYGLSSPFLFQSSATPWTHKSWFHDVMTRSVPYAVSSPPFHGAWIMPNCDVLRCLAELWRGREPQPL